MEKIVFVDMDGVVSDFIGGVFKLHGHSSDIAEKFKGRYDISTFLDMSSSDFWRIIGDNDYFWEELEETADGKEIMSYLEESVGAKNIYFLSSPAHSSACYSGKAAWIAKHYGAYVNRLILTGNKHLLASRGRLLIDDSDDNCSKFSEYGGSSFLYPRPWNSKFTMKDKALELFKKEIRRFL